MKKTLAVFLSAVAVLSWAPVIALGAGLLFVDDNGNVGIGNITPQHKLDVSGAIYSRLVSASSTVDWNAGNVQSMTLTSSPTISFNDGQAGGEYTLILKQDSTGGRAVSWPNSVLWANGSVPSLTAAADSIDVCSFIYDGVNYLGSCASNYNNQRTLATYTDYDSSYSQFGQTGTYRKLAQPFTISSSAKVLSVSVYVKKENSPSDHVKVSIYSDSSGAPGTLLENGTDIDPTSSLSMVKSSFSGTTQLNTGVTYWLVLERTGSLDTSNDYVWGLGSVGPTYSAIENYNGSIWSNSYGGTYNGNFIVIGN